MSCRLLVLSVLFGFTIANSMENKKNNDRTEWVPNSNPFLNYVVPESVRNDPNRQHAPWVDDHEWVRDNAKEMKPDEAKKWLREYKEINKKCIVASTEHSDRFDTFDEIAHFNSQIKFIDSLLKEYEKKYPEPSEKKRIIPTSPVSLRSPASPRSNKALDDINHAIYLENARRKKEEENIILLKEERERRENAVDEKWLRKKARGVHADDIVPAGKWVNEFNYGVLPTTDGDIRRTDTYTPRGIDEDSNVEAAMIVVHGTWGAPTKSFYKDTSSKYQNYRHIKRFAAWYASKYQKKLSLESYQWSGELDEVSRGNAACRLKDYINDHHAHDQLVLMSHSHGGNIISEATHSLNNPADLLVY